MGIFRVFRYSEVLGGPRNRTLSDYKSVGIRHFFANIEGGPLSGAPYAREKVKIRLPPPYTREKVKIRLLRGRSDFDVPKNRQNPQKNKKTRSESAESDFDVAKNRGPLRGPPGAPPGPRGPLRAPPGPLRGPLIVGATGTAGRAPSF